MSSAKYTADVNDVTSQESIDNSPDDDVKIVSLDPRHSDEEQDRICVIFENQFEDSMKSSRFSEAAALAERMIESFPGIWRPVEEREDCTVRAFWDWPELMAYRRCHQNSAKPIVWGQPSLSRLYYSLGAAYFSDLEVGRGEACIAKAIELEPDHPRLWMRRATVLNWENRYEEALEVLQTAATIRSWIPAYQMSDCLRAQGVALGGLRHLPEARDAFARALEMDPDNALARTDLERVTRDLEKLRMRESGAPQSSYVM